MHPLYRERDSDAWDAALLILESRSRALPVAMAPWNARYLTAPRERFLVAGFGMTQAQTYPDDLRATWVPFVSRGECIPLAEANNVGAPPFSHICAGERGFAGGRRGLVAGGARAPARPAVPQKAHAPAPPTRLPAAPAAHACMQASPSPTSQTRAR